MRIADMIGRRGRYVTIGMLGYSFLGSLAICLWLVRANGLGLPWVGLAVAVSISNTAFEFFSPRGTDDFTMATGNALRCWAFGRLVY